MKNKIVISLLGILIIASIAGNIYQFNRNKILNESVSGHASELETLVVTLAEKDVVLTEMSAKNEELEDSLSDLQSKIKELQSSISEMESANAELRQQIEDLTAEKDELEKSMAKTSSNGGTSTQPSNPQPSGGGAASGDPDLSSLFGNGNQHAGDIPTGGSTGADNSGRDYGGGY